MNNQAMRLMLDPRPRDSSEEGAPTSPSERHSDAVCADLLESERLRLEGEIGKPVFAVGLFRRVPEATVGAYLLGGVFGVAIGIALLLVLSLFAAVIGMKEGMGIIGLMAMVSGLGLGQVAAARLLRNAKEIPDDFGIAVVGNRIHFCTWDLDGEAKTVRLSSVGVI